MLSQQKQRCVRDLQTFQICAQLSCSTKTKHSRGNIINTRSDISHLRDLREQLVVFHNKRKTWERARYYSSIHQHGGKLVHPTTSSAPRPIVLMVVNIFKSSTNGSDCCCTNMIDIEINSRCPEVGRKRRPQTTHGTRERQRQRAAFATRKDTSASK